MLTYETYRQLGGSVDEVTFLSTVKKAVQKLNYFTLNKAVECPEVNECLTRFIDYMAEQNNDNISSFSNGNVSVSFRETNANDDLYAIAEELLPIEMLSRCVNEV